MRFEGKFRISNTYIVICFRQNMLKVLKRGKRKMQYQWFVFWSGLFDWLIFSVSLFVIADKLGWQKKRPGSPVLRPHQSFYLTKA